jgi:hypothetical protein
MNNSTIGPYTKNSVINLSNGTFTVNEQGFTAKQYRDGWWRVSVVYTTGGTYQGTTWSIYCLDSSSPSTDTIDNAEHCYVWGEVYEVGSFITSYIGTESNVRSIRGADQCYIDGQNFLDFYNPIESTILIDYTHDITSSQLGTNQRVYKFQAVGGNDTRIDYVSNSGYNPYIARDGSSPANLSHGQSTVFGGGVNRSAVRVKENSFAVSFNGSAVSGNAEDTSGNWNPANAITEVFIGSSNDGNSPVNGHIRRFAYYPVGLPNSQLVTLTS